MKRRLLLTLALLTGCAHAQAEDAHEASMILNAYTGGAEALVIPAELQGLPVTAIGDSCFAEAGVRELPLPDTVTAIGEYAFRLCLLEPLRGMENILHLDGGTFFGAHIAEPVLPAGLLSMGDAVLQHCDFLTEISAWPPARIAGLYRGGRLCAVPQPLPDRPRRLLCRSLRR